MSNPSDFIKSVNEEELESEISDMIADDDLAPVEPEPEPTPDPAPEPEPDPDPKPAEGKGEGEKPSESPAETPPEPTPEVTPEGNVPGEEGTVKPEETPPVEPPAPADGETVTLTKEQHEQLLSKLDELAGTPPAKPVDEPATHVPVKPEDIVPKQPTQVAGLDEVLANMDFDAVMESKESFAEFLKTTMAVVQEQTAQKVLTSIPNVVGNFVQQRATMQEVAKEFYGRYPELKRVKRYVSKVADEISGKNPDWNIGQVLEEAAKVTKETLGVQNLAVEGNKGAVTKPKSSAPALPGNQGVRQPSKPPSGLQSEIDDLISD